MRKQELEKHTKEWVDAATYEQLLAHWRYAPLGDPCFDNTKGVFEHYQKVMAEKRKTADHVVASKRIGWNP